MIWMQAELREQKDIVLGWMKRVYDYSRTSAGDLNKEQGQTHPLLKSLAEVLE